MLLNKNIKTKNPNSFYHLLIGLIFIGMATWVAVVGYKKPLGIDQFDWVYIGLFGITGLWFTIKGLKAIVSKAFLKVNDSQIVIKSDEFNKATSIYWDDIEYFEAKQNKFIVKLKDGTQKEIIFSYYNDLTALELRKSIEEFANKKTIKIIKDEKVKYLA